jgi:hypothetical protein
MSVTPLACPMMLPSCRRGVFRSSAQRAASYAFFAVFSTEALGGIMALEASHTSDPALDTAMVLFKTIVQVGTGPMPHGLAQHGANRSGVGAVTICRDPVRSKAHGRPRRAEEGLGGLHIAMLARHCVDQVSVPVDRPVEVAPPAANLQVRPVDMMSLGRQVRFRTPLLRSLNSARSPGSGTAGSLAL